MDLYDRNDPHKSGPNKFGTKRCHIQEKCVAICRFLWCYTNNDQSDRMTTVYTTHKTCKCMQMLPPAIQDSFGSPFIDDTDASSSQSCAWRG